MNTILLIALFGATPIKLQEVRDLSRANIAQRLSELSAAIATESKRTSLSAILPQVNVAADMSRTFLSAATSQFIPVPVGDHYEQPKIDVIAYNRNNFDVSATLTQLLFDGGKWWNQIAESGAAEEAARGQAIEQQFASEFEGVRRFYALITAQKTLDVLVENEKRSANQLVVANALYEAARSSKSDAVQAQINLGNDQISTVTQIATIGSSQSDLATWIAHPGAEELLAVEPAELQGEPLPAPTLEGSLQIARDHRPLLRALASQVRAADLGVAVARGGYWPSLQGQLAYLRQGNTRDPFFTNSGKNNQFSMGLSLRWNLFSGFATSAQVRTALYNRAAAQLNLEQSTHDVEADVRRNLRALESSLKAAKFARANWDVATYGLTLAQDRFKAGAGSTLEVRDAQLKLAQAELTLIQNRVNVEVARANLERVIGAYLKENS